MYKNPRIHALIYSTPPQSRPEEMASSHDPHRELPPLSSQMLPTDSGDGGSSWQADASLPHPQYQYTGSQSFPQGSNRTNNNALDIYFPPSLLADSASRSPERELEFTSQFTAFPFEPLGYNTSPSRTWQSDIHPDTTAVQINSPTYPVWLGYPTQMTPPSSFVNPPVSEYRADSHHHRHSPAHLSPISASGPSFERLLSPGYSTSSSGSQHLSPVLQPVTPPLTPECPSFPLVKASPGGSGGSPFSSDSNELPRALVPHEHNVKQLYSHHDQVNFFRHVAASAAAGHGPFVPQRMYKPHTNSDRRRYVEDVDLEYPIMFWSEHPDECGIPLSDALHSRVKRLLHRDETVFEGRGPSVSIRLEWPGYRQWSRQIPTKDFRSPPGPITRAKLAKNVAKCISRFIDEKQNRPLEEEADERWRVGNNTGLGQIRLDDLILVSLHHVSMGSWQPHLKLRRALH